MKRSPVPCQAASFERQSAVGNRQSAMAGRLPRRAASKVVPFFLPNRGCPSRCVYCDQSVAAGTAPQDPCPAEIEACLRDAATRFRAPVETAFFGATFTAMPRSEQERLLAPILRLKREGIVDRLRISTHPAHIEEDVLAFLREHEVDVLELGIQSFSDRVLAAAGRGVTADQSEAACRRVLEAGLELVVQLMPFLPDSTQQDDVESARRTAALRPSAARIFPTLVLEGTLLAGLLADGRYRPATLEKTVARVARMLEPLHEAGVPVLRIGLQPSERLEESLQAGPYHPALGELCRAAWLARAMAKVIGRRGEPFGQGEHDGDHDVDANADGRTGGPVLSVSRELASLVLGHRRFGLKRLHEETGRSWKVQVEEKTAGAAPGVSIGDNLVVTVYTAGVRLERERK